MYRDAFNKFDEDGGGTIDASELTNVFDTLGMPTDNIDELMKEVDTDGDGTLQFEEFLAMAAKRRDAMGGRDMQRQMFDQMANGSSFITPEQLGAFMTRLNGGISDTHIDAMIRYADQSGNGKISFEELCSAIAPPV